MVAAIDNLTCLAGTISARVDHPTLAGYDLVTVQVDAAVPVPGLADLLGRHLGTALAVAVRRELLGDAAVGRRIRLRARAGLGGAIAEKAPAAGDFGVDP